MSKIRPFRGLRPKLGLAQEIASPPYDVMDSSEARILAKNKPLSFLHVVKPEIDLPEDIDLYDDRVYATAAANLRSLASKGNMLQDERGCFYAYRQKMGDHIQTGLVVCASCDEYENDLIKKHELTRKDKENDRTRHVNETDANTGPVFLTYRSQDKIDSIIEQVTQTETTYDFTADDGIVHTLWVIKDDETIEKLEAAFEAVPCTYVADGHHRTASGWRVRELRKQDNPDHTGNEEYNWFMAVVFPHDQLKILDYNRAVMDLNGESPDVFLAKVKEKFDIATTTDGKPTKAHDFGMFLDGTWHCLTAKEGTFNPKEPVDRLDVSILQKNLLAPLLGVGDPRTDKRIKFVGGIRGIGELERLVNDGKFAVAFALYPTSVEDLMAIADAKEIMPPKSTWFEPKLRSGLIVHLLSDW